MTGLRARIGAAVTFIHDPVPMRERAQARGRAFHDHVERIIRERDERADFGFDGIDWPFGHSNPPPPSSPPPYNWATRFAWPRDGCAS